MRSDHPLNILPLRMLRYFPNHDRIITGRGKKLININLHVVEIGPDGDIDENSDNYYG